MVFGLCRSAKPQIAQINSEINCIAMYKYTESQKLDYLKEAWDADVRTLNALSPHVSRPKNNNTVYFRIACIILYVLYVITA